MTRPDMRSAAWRAGNALAAALARAGVSPMWMLTTRDRRTGTGHTIPVVPVDQGGRRWLVAPYGVVGWVRNARADPRVGLRRGRARAEHRVREAGAHEAGPVLRRYVEVAPRSRRAFVAQPGAPASAFAAEADMHPVFELLPPGDALGPRPAPGG